MKKLYLLDANSLIHRAFHALPPFTAPGGGPTGALYGLSAILLKIIREDAPDYIAAFFDRPEPTFREQIFAEYKIQRPKAPDELVSQIIGSHELFEKFGIKTFEIPGFEADDLIGTAVAILKAEPDLKITILSGDLDTLQLIDNAKISVKYLKKGVSETMVYDEAAVKERYGVTPGELPDYKGLVGDQSDNIPGVSGIGPKTASGLIQKYGNLENFFAKGRKEKAFEKISATKDQALLSRQLSTIRRDAPLDIKSSSDIRYSGLPLKNIIPYFENLGFKSLVNRLNPAAPPEKTETKPKKEKGAARPAPRQTLF